MNFGSRLPGPRYLHQEPPWTTRTRRSRRCPERPRESRMVPIPLHGTRSQGITRIERIPTSGGNRPRVRSSLKPSRGDPRVPQRPVGETRCRATPSPAEVQRWSLGTRGDTTCRAPCSLNPLPSSSPSTPSTAPPHGEVKTDRQDPPPASSPDLNHPARGGPGEEMETERQ